MTTPLLYLANWFKNNLKSKNNDLSYASKLSFICLDVDRQIQKKFLNSDNLKRDYLN